MYIKIFIYMYIYIYIEMHNDVHIPRPFENETDRHIYNDGEITSERYMDIYIYMITERERERYRDISRAVHQYL